MNLPDRNTCDPDNPCEAFTHRPSNRDCWGDGHYLCRYCRRLDPLGADLYTSSTAALHVVWAGAGPRVVPDVVVIDAPIVDRILED